MGASQIARKLKSKQYPCRSVYTYRKLGLSHFTMNLENPCDWSESTIVAILENEVYPDNTINMRYSTKSYKDKRRITHPREK